MSTEFRHKYLTLVKISCIFSHIFCFFEISSLQRLIFRPCRAIINVEGSEANSPSPEPLLGTFAALPRGIRQLPGELENVSKTAFFKRAISASFVSLLIRFCFIPRYISNRFSLRSIPRAFRVLLSVYRISSVFRSIRAIRRAAQLFPRRTFQRFSVDFHVAPQSAAPLFGDQFPKSHCKAKLEQFSLPRRRQNMVKHLIFGAKRAKSTVQTALFECFSAICFDIAPRFIIAMYRGYLLVFCGFWAFFAHFAAKSHPSRRSAQPCVRSADFGPGKSRRHTIFHFIYTPSHYNMRSACQKYILSSPSPPGSCTSKTHSAPSRHRSLALQREPHPPRAAGVTSFRRHAPIPLCRSVFVFQIYLSSHASLGFRVPKCTSRSHASLGFRVPNIPRAHTRRSVFTS